MSEMMKALVYEGPREMNMREVPLPAITEEEVLVLVKAVGICGSELSGYVGQNSLRVPPLVMGHEFAGVIAAIGSRAGTLSIGDRVTANPLAICRSCSNCLTGRGQLCNRRSLLGAHRAGAFAQYVAVPVQNVLPLPDDVTMEEGALTEPFACGVHIARLAALGPADTLLIVGAGPIGLLTLIAARQYGVNQIVVQDINAERLEIVKDLGGVGVTGEEGLLTVQPTEGFSAAVDAVGLDVTRQLCINKVRSGGRVIFSGLHAADSVLPVNAAIRNEIMMQGAFAYTPDDFALALRWIGEGKVNLKPWMQSSPLADGRACFEKLLGNPGNVAKIMLYVD